MSAVAFSPPESRLHTTFSNSYNLSMEMSASDRRMSSANEAHMAPPTLLLRRLPRNTTAEAVRTMLLFAKDLQDTEIVPNEYEEDTGFSTAIARFASMTGASEAQAMLDGKPNTAGAAKMIVDVIAGPSFIAVPRRNTIDPMMSRKIAQSVSPPLSGAQRSSRFNGTFQAMDKTSPPLGSPPDHSSSETSSHLQTLFSPHSPVADRARVSGKKVIDEDGGDDETGELLKDPLAYLNSTSNATTARKQSSLPQGRLPTNAFAALSLNTNMNGASPGYSARSTAQGRNSFSPFSAPGSNGSYNPMSSQPYPIRHNYPPVNPADQNPPCNTLYVGNLPIDTSEDELKAMFSKQRGYKRLCFRTKQNGPMCFVEFEDISFATKALNELYGAQLHNSVKGGIRLSFSKNPLGVRAGQPGSSSPATPLGITGPMGMNGFSGLTPGGFSTASGPPPGLSAPPGLNMSIASPVGIAAAPSMNGSFVNPGMAVGNMRPVPMNNGPSPSQGMYPDYMLGR